MGKSFLEYIRLYVHIKYKFFGNIPILNGSVYIIKDKAWSLLSWTVFHLITWIRRNWKIHQQFGIIKSVDNFMQCNIWKGKIFFEWKQFYRKEIHTTDALGPSQFASTVCCKAQTCITKLLVHRLVTNQDRNSDESVEPYDIPFNIDGLRINHCRYISQWFLLRFRFFPKLNTELNIMRLQSYVKRIQNNSQLNIYYFVVSNNSLLIENILSFSRLQW